MGTTSNLPSIVRILAAENEIIKAENGQLKSDQSAALDLIVGQESQLVEQKARITNLTHQVAELTLKVESATPEPVGE